MINEFQKQLQKRDIVCFFLMVFFFTSTISSATIYVLKKNRYVFDPDYDIKKVIFRDQIDSMQMLDKVLKSPCIKKEFSPNLGDFVGYKGDELLVAPRKEILYQYNVHVLDKSKPANEFVFSSNSVTITRDSLVVERIKSSSTIKNIKYSWYLFNSDVYDVQIGDYVWKSPEDKYYIVKNNDLYIKKHLYDSSLDGLVCIDDIKNALNNS